MCVCVRVVFVWGVCVCVRAWVWVGGCVCGGGGGLWCDVRAWCVFQALDALKAALQQEPSDSAVRAELHFSLGNQLREMNELDRAFQVTSPAAVSVSEELS